MLGDGLPEIVRSSDDTEGEGEIDVADGTRLTDTTFRGATKLTCAVFLSSDECSLILMDDFDEREAVLPLYPTLLMLPMAGERSGGEA